MDETNVGIEGSDNRGLETGRPDLSPTNPNVVPNDTANGGATTKKVLNYAGIEFEVPEQVFAAWQQRESDFAHRLSEQGEELGVLKRQLQTDTAGQVVKPTSDVSPVIEEDDEELAQLAFSDPVAYSKRIREIIKSESKKLKEDLVMNYTVVERAKEARKVLDNFWGDFYREYPELKKLSRVVEKILEDDLALPIEKQEIARLDPKEAGKALSTKVKTYLQEFIPKENISLGAIGGSTTTPILPAPKVENPYRGRTLTERIAEKRKQKGL